MPLLGGELVEGLGVEHLAVLDRRQSEAGRGAQQDDAGGPRPAFHLAEQLFLARLELVLEGLHGVAVFVAVERRRQAAHQSAHVGLQVTAGTGGQTQCAGLVGSAEIVDVAPVVGCLHLSGLLGEQVADNGVLAQTW
ncbi:hypothetical protein D3C84_906860 [compost metagenome]